MNNIKSFYPSLIAVLVLLAPLLVACGSGEEESDATESSSDLYQQIMSQSGASETAVDVTPSPILVNNEKEAVRKLWVYLTTCISIDISDLQAEVAGDSEWIVMPTEKSPQEFGAWRVNSKGKISWHNNRAKLWEEYIASECDPAIMTPAATDVLNESDAVSAVWTQLAKCNPELPLKELTAQKNRKTGSWVVVTSLKSQDDYGVWSVERDASIKPLNDRAVDVKDALKLVETGRASDANTDMAAQCSPVIRTDEESVNRIWSHLSACYPTLDKKKEVETTWDPGTHRWVTVTILDESSTDPAPVWNVDRSGAVTPVNDSAVAANKRVSMDSC